MSWVPKAERVCSRTATINLRVPEGGGVRGPTPRLTRPTEKRRRLLLENSKGVHGRGRTKEQGARLGETVGAASSPRKGSKPGWQVGWERVGHVRGFGPSSDSWN